MITTGSISSYSYLLNSFVDSIGGRLSFGVVLRIEELVLALALGHELAQLLQLGALLLSGKTFAFRLFKIINIIKIIRQFYILQGFLILSWLTTKHFKIFSNMLNV